MMHVLSTCTTFHLIETHTVPTSFIMLHLAARFLLMAHYLVLRGCKWSAEATQGETNNNFITITP